MESDVIDLGVLHGAVTQIILNGTLKGRVTTKRFLWHCGAKRTNERKVNGKWLTHLKIIDRNKWLLAKIKYGF
jgi:hypothetical protein